MALDSRAGMEYAYCNFEYKYIAIKKHESEYLSSEFRVSAVAKATKVRGR